MLKLKKILSLVSAFAIAATAFAGMTVAKADDNGPTIYTVLEKKNFSDSSDYDGYTQYVLTVKVKNLSDISELTYTGMGTNKKYTGAAVNGFQVDLDYDATKVGVCDLVGLVSGGTFTPNAEEGSFMWSSTKIDEYVQTQAFDLAEIRFVSIADADWNPATEDYTVNPICFQVGENQKIAYKKYEGGKVAEGIDGGYSLNAGTLVAENGTYGATEPEITINDKYVFNFTAEEGQDVMVTLKRTNGITSDLTYALPKDVKGTASIFGLLKVVDATVVSGDEFDIDVVDADRKVVKPITTITVQAADLQ